jgi:hypothetical protein
MGKRTTASRTAAGARWLALFLLCSPVLASPSEGVDLPLRWQVRTDGWSGTLELKVESSGKISGTLQDRAVTGFLAGRRLVLRRAIGDHTEVWEGWLSGDSDSSELFVAGSVTVSDRDGGPVHPWYAVPEPGEVGPADPVVLAPEESAASGPADSPAADDPGYTRPPASGQERWDLSGVWLTSDGRIEIVQEGRSLSVVLPDGTRHEGRFTAIDMIVIGLRKGCCKGKLQHPDQISWSDGSVWRRGD